MFSDGPPMTWTDTNGDTRYACVHVPSSASAVAKVPLLVFLHGSHGGADDLYNATSLRSKADTFVLSTVAGRLGFVIASVQGRNLFMKSDYWSFDPEFNNFGNQNFNRFIDLAPYPSNRQFFFSIDLGY